MNVVYITVEMNTGILIFIGHVLKVVVISTHHTESSTLELMRLLIITGDYNCDPIEVLCDVFNIGYAPFYRAQPSRDNIR
jgi:hypothetical protein